MCQKMMSNRYEQKTQNRHIRYFLIGLLLPVVLMPVKSWAPPFSHPAHKLPKTQSDILFKSLKKPPEINNHNNLYLQKSFPQSNVSDFFAKEPLPLMEYTPIDSPFTVPSTTSTK